MKIHELTEAIDTAQPEQLPPMPHLYLDMDGVQADFFTAWANIHDKARYKEIGGKEEREQSISDLTNRGPEFIYKFFATLPPLSGGNQLVNWLKQNKIPFTILSAPLRGNYEASIEGKKDWLDQYNPGTSGAAIFTGMKEKYATTSQPNVLVDDHKKYIERWESAGGIGVLHRDNNTQGTIAQLSKIYAPYLSNNISEGDVFELELGDLLIETVVSEVLADGIVIHMDETALQMLDQVQELYEAEYQGRKVPLGKPMQGDVKKSKVYVKNAKGNVVKVNFGDPNMTIKRSNPKRRKSFRARHNCANPGPRWKARYWSCRAW